MRMGQLSPCLQALRLPLGVAPVLGPTCFTQSHSQDSELERVRSTTVVGNVTRAWRGVGVQGWDWGCICRCAVSPHVFPRAFLVLILVHLCPIQNATPHSPSRRNGTEPP